MRYDAVIIGAGHNGLAAAAHLASRGWSVAVFEKAMEPGGACKTREVTLPGFRHDLFAMNLSLFAGSPFMKMHGAALMRHGLQFAGAEHCFATPFADGTWFGVSKDAEANAKRADALSSEDGVAWRRLTAEFPANAETLFALLGTVIPSRALAGLLWKTWRAKGSGYLMEMGRLLVSSPRGFLDETFRSDKIKATLGAWGLHLDFAPDIAGGALFPYLEAMADQAFGMAIGKGGADVMIRALTSYLKELKGEVNCSAEVVRIDRMGGKASGITLADGRQITAKKAVIATALPQHVFGRLLGDGSGNDAVDRKMKAFRLGPGTMMIHVACNGLPEWVAGDELKRFAYVHLAPSLAMMSRAYEQAMAGQVPDEPVLVVGQPTAIDPSRAPDGKHILWIQVRVLPGVIDGGWAAQKEAYADRMVRLLECYAPDFSKQIIGRTVFSPEDLEAENPNLVGGDQIGGSHHLSQNFLFRPAPGWSRYKTPLDNLYLCGASTWPGAGLGAGSGFMLAKMLAGGA
jgi:phytoene dehydrogenase-like protein